ncbi:MAG TPA: hypothetical protein VK469_19210, partial [Candidatus Kapabacteria bacterium]|nr:hypothetical protein [Candidatus Kapabacteria bacterium]
LMRKEIENFVDMQFENDFSGWKESTENSDIKIKKKEIVTVKFLNMYKDIERIVDRIEPVEIYFNNTFKIKPLYFSLGFGGSLINSALIPDFDELKFANFEVGYHFKFGYFLDDSILLTPFILGANQLGEQVSFNLSTTNYTLAVKAEKAAMFGVGLKLIMRDTIEKVGNMELGLGLFYSRYYLNIHGINNELTNTSLAFIEIDNRKFQDIFYINMEISFEAFPWLYVGIRYTFPTTSKLLFKYEININPETKLNFKFPAGIAAVTSLGIKIYI